MARSSLMAAWAASAALLALVMTLLAASTAAAPPAGVPALSDAALVTVDGGGQSVASVVFDDTSITITPDLPHLPVSTGNYVFNEAQGQVTITWTAGLSGTGEGIFLVNGVSGNFELAVGVTTGVPRPTTFDPASGVLTIHAALPTDALPDGVQPHNPTASAVLFLPGDAAPTSLPVALVFDIVTGELTIDATASGLGNLGGLYSFDKPAGEVDITWAPGQEPMLSGLGLGIFNLNAQDGTIEIAVGRTAAIARPTAFAPSPDVLLLVAPLAGGGGGGGGGGAAPLPQGFMPLYPDATAALVLPGGGTPTVGTAMVMFDEGSGTLNIDASSIGVPTLVGTYSFDEVNGFFDVEWAPGQEPLVQGSGIGIYGGAGNAFVLAVTINPNEPRPTDFSNPTETVLVLSLGTNLPAGIATTNNDATVALMMNGSPAVVGAPVYFTAIGGVVIDASAAGLDAFRGTYTFDEVNSFFDIVWDAGQEPFVSGTGLGIYNINADGSVVLSVTTAPGAARPLDFEPAADTLVLALPAGAGGGGGGGGGGNGGLPAEVMPINPSSSLVLFAPGSADPTSLLADLTFNEAGQTILIDATAAGIGAFTGTYMFDEVNSFFDVEWDAGQEPFVTGTGLGIYSVNADGTVMLAVTAAPGASRPVDFQPAPGTFILALPAGGGGGGGGGGGNVNFPALLLASYPSASLVVFVPGSPDPASLLVDLTFDDAAQTILIDASASAGFAYTGTITFDEAAGEVDVAWDAGLLGVSGTGQGIFRFNEADNTIEIIVAGATELPRPTTYGPMPGYLLIVAPQNPGGESPLPFGITTVYGGTMTTSSGTFPVTAEFMPGTSMVVFDIGGLVTLTGVYSFDEANGRLDVAWLSDDAGNAAAGVTGAGLGIYQVNADFSVDVALGALPIVPRPSDFGGGSGVLTAHLVPEGGDNGCPAIDYNTVTFAELPVGTWRVMRPGGLTGCARGGEFSFMVRRGSVEPNKVVFELQGGGACWDDMTCLDDSFMEVSSTLTGVDCTPLSSFANGFMDNTDPSNPTRGWTHIFVPYCTRDVHWGSNSVQYQFPDLSPNPINHNGFNNVKSVLEFMYRVIPEPDSVLVAGCSAGSLGAVVYAPYIMAHYRNAEVSLIADSAPGIVTEAFVRSYMHNWNPFCAIPAKAIPPLRRQAFPFDRTATTALWLNSAEALPRRHFGFYSAINDATMSGFHFLMGGGSSAQEAVADYGARLAALSAELDANGHSNVRQFLVPGSTHCTAAGSDAWNQIVEGTKFQTWAWSIIHGDETLVPRSVICPTCTSAAQPGCDGFGSVLDACNVCGGDGSSCAGSLPTPPEEVVCPNGDSVSFIQRQGACGGTIPQAIWNGGAAWDSYCEPQLHVCCLETGCSPSDVVDVKGVRYYRRNAIASAGMTMSASCPSDAL